jgi:hypothetical protein
MKSQNEILLKYLKSGKRLTSLGAVDALGIARLASRVHDLKCAGHDVKSRFITVRNRWNYEVRVKQYWI